MRYGIPLFAGRVAPRCTIAESIMVIRVNYGRIISKDFIEWGESSFVLLMEKLIDLRIDTLVCGGINKEDKKIIKSNGITIIDNVACSSGEICSAVEKNQLRSGYGFTSPVNQEHMPESSDISSNLPRDFNCLRCPGNECRSGGKCPYIKDMIFDNGDTEQFRMLDSALDISLEEERNLCRLSELIYYALEMKYRKIGVAYCTDLQEATEILVSVLRRFFEVNTVCCKVSGALLSEDTASERKKVACNPFAQAEVLNKLGTDLNIMVGLCIGADCIFADQSNAPVTTLFVKDKSLANNPIGALYSEYYLQEVKADMTQ